MMTSSAGEDKVLRRWRITLTVGAWLLILQSGSGAVFGLLSTMVAANFQWDTVLGQLGPLFSGANIAAVGQLTRQILVVNRVQIAANAVLVAGAFGLLRRQKWGWFTVVVVHVAEVFASFIWAMPMMRTVVTILDPANASRTSLLMTALIAMIPASIVAFLMLKPIVSQFENSRASPPAATIPALGARESLRESGIQTGASGAAPDSGRRTPGPMQP